MNFIRRPYQHAITSHILRNPRCNVWATMGSGKTGSVLWSLNRLFCSGKLIDWDASSQKGDRILVLAPQRVASGTWPAEGLKWGFSRLRIIDATGGEKERISAINEDANVVCINYENISWLIDYYGDEWPFSVVVADESTRLKSFRTKSGGSKRAKALSKVAFKKVKRFINLTGTPSPNGLKDLWGQNWFIDGGERLGTSFADFSRRWFSSVQKGSHYAARDYVPLPRAEAEIYKKLKDISITVDAADYFGCDKPVIIPVTVELPAKARQVYDDMELKLFAELTSGEVEAANAAAKTSKCLQIASGAVYVTSEDGERTNQWEHIHDAKLSALESIISELSGAPLLVAYQYKHDLERILKKFPQAQALMPGSRGNHQVDLWNAGGIEILCTHPASAGHGLNLQDGGHHLAIFSDTWNLEHFLQMVERIGPIRQMQSGHPRPVFVYQIQAIGTLDQVVAERRDGKKNVQDILMQYMKHKVTGTKRSD